MRISDWSSDVCSSDLKVIGLGLGTGVVSGFFGIGGGFLIVPSLMASTRMPMINAVGTSLVAVTAFGLTTALTTPFRVWWTGRWHRCSSSAAFPVALRERRRRTARP